MAATSSRGSGITSTETICAAHEEALHALDELERAYFEGDEDAQVGWTTACIFYISCLPNVGPYHACVCRWNCEPVWATGETPHRAIIALRRALADDQFQLLIPSGARSSERTLPHVHAGARAGSHATSVRAAHSSPSSTGARFQAMELAPRTQVAPAQPTGREGRTTAAATVVPPAPTPSNRNPVIPGAPAAVPAVPSASPPAVGAPGVPHEVKSFIEDGAVAERAAGDAA